MHVYMCQDQRTVYYIIRLPSETIKMRIEIRVYNGNWNLWRSVLLYMSYNILLKLSYLTHSPQRVSKVYWVRNKER